MAGDARARPFLCPQDRAAPGKGTRDPRARESPFPAAGSAALVPRPHPAQSWMLLCTSERRSFAIWALHGDAGSSGAGLKHAVDSKPAGLKHNCMKQCLGAWK